MTSEEFINQQIEAGYNIHYHKGIWWQRYWPFFYKPVSHFQEVMPGKSNPKLYKSFLGYKHLVSNKQLSNQYWPVMVLNYNKLNEYSIYSLPSQNRSGVRKGLKLTEINRIKNVELVIEDIKNICITTRMRIHHGKPVKYYFTEEWRRWIRKEFSLPKREWWGAFVEKKLIAYIYGVQIDDTMFMYATKSHTDYLDKRPNDALIFTFLNYCKELPDCKKVIFGDGGAGTPALNAFKEKLGFEEINMPVYARYNPVTSLYRKLRTHFSKERQ